MRLHFFPLVALLALLARSRAASAEVMRAMIPGLPVEIAGADTSATLTIELDDAADRIGATELELVWQRSDLLDPIRSTITVEIDGATRRTAHLGVAGHHDQDPALRVALTDLAGGFHQVRVRARLVVEGEPSDARRPHDTWMRLLPASNVTWERAAHPAAGGGIAALVRAWQQHPGAPVDLVPRVALDPVGAVAFLEADALLRGWNLAPRLRNEPSSGPALLLVEGDPVLEATPSARAIVRSSRKTLLVAGVTPGDVRDALLALRSDKLRELCPDEVCLLDGHYVGPPAAPKPEREVATTRVLKLGERGYPQGWAARGEGEHVLSFVWERPAEWTVTSWPEVDLPVVSSAFDAGAADPSRATLLVNGLPIATWTFAADARPERLTARVPRDFWPAASLSFELHVNLHISDASRRHAESQDASWLLLGREGEVRVPHREARSNGIASFFRGHRGHPPPILWSESLDWHRLSWLAALLSPLRAEAGSDGFRIVPSCDEGACIVVGAPGSPCGPLSLVPSELGEAWSDSSKLLPIPLLAAEGTVAIGYSTKSEETRGRLTVSFPSSLSTDPPLALGADGVITHHAVYFKRAWSELADDEADVTVEIAEVDTSPTPAADRAAATPPDEQVRLRRLDGLAFGLIALVLILGVRWVRRKQRVAESPKGSP